MKRNNKKGFTIVELVIVIAVIAILSAVLIPTFGGITEKANKSALDQEAKNAFTNYLIDCDANPDTDAMILVTKNGKTYAYDINEDGQIVFPEESVESTCVCTVSGEGYTIGYAAHVDTDPDHGHCDVCGIVVEAHTACDDGCKIEGCTGAVPAN